MAHPHAAIAGLALIALLAVGCGGETSADGDEATASASKVEVVLERHGLDSPSALALRPRSDELWVTNRGDDSITVVSHPDRAKPHGVTRRDGYAEHFVALPSGIAFDRSGRSFAVANDSDNGVRGMVFVKNPERNRYFKGSNFMGPALFHTATYARAGQSKRYLQDWPQPGYGHSAPHDTPRDDCPGYWSVESDACEWPREGSHVDMLHGSPRSVGILHAKRNAYFLLDGCGIRTDGNACRFVDGHVVMVDFNRDHQEGNGFHGDGVIRRYIDAPFTRVKGVSSGMVRHDGAIYYADTGAGVVRRLRPDTGELQTIVAPWHSGKATHHAHGPGITDWGQAAHSPGDGDDPGVIDAWISDHGDQRAIEALGERWIKPMETLGEYSYVHGARGEVVVGDDVVEEPSGLAASERSLFVADHSTGLIHELAWDGLRERRVIETGRRHVDGLAYGDGWLYFTDAGSDAVLRVRVGT